jgi:hypothetical protein
MDKDKSASKQAFSGKAAGTMPAGSKADSTWQQQQPGALKGAQGGGAQADKVEVAKPRMEPRTEQRAGASERKPAEQAMDKAAASRRDV